MTAPDRSTDPYVPPTSGAAAVSAVERRVVDWRKVRWAIAAWFSFFVMMWGIIGVMNLTTDPLHPPPHWWRNALAIAAVSVGVGFVIYNLVLLVWILTGRFRKP